MTAFFGAFVKYVVEAVILLGIGICGGAIGIKLRKKKDAKLAVEKADK